MLSKCVSFRTNPICIYNDEVDTLSVKVDKCNGENIKACLVKNWGILKRLKTNGLMIHLKLI